MQSLIQRAQGFLRGFFLRTLPNIVRLATAILSFSALFYGVVMGVNYVFMTVLTALGVILPLAGFAGFMLTVVYMITCWKLGTWIWNLSIVQEWFAWLLAPPVRVYTYA